MKRTLIIQIFIWGMTFSNTYANDLKELNLKNYLNTYLSKSKTIAIKNSNTDLYEQKKIEARSQYLPSGSLINQTSKTDTFGSDTDRTLSTKIKNQTYIKLSQNIFNGFKDKASLESSKLNLEKSQIDLSDSQMQEVGNALDLYYGILKSETIIENIQKEIESNQKNLADLQRNLAVGNAKKSQVLSVQSTLASNQVDLLEARETYNNYLIKINQSIGSNFSELSVERVKFLNENVIDQLDLNSRLDLKSLKLNTLSLQQQIDVAQSGRLPTLDLSGNYYLTDNATSNSLKKYYSVSLTLNIPFPFGEETKAQVTAARINHNNSLLLERQKVDELEKEKNIIINSIKSFKERIKSLESAKSIAEENTKFLKKDYQAGLNSYSDYLSASTSYQQIIRKYESLKIDYELALLKATIWSGNIELLLK